MKFGNFFKKEKMSSDNVTSKEQYKFPSYNDKANSKRAKKAVKEIRRILRHKHEDCYDSANFEAMKYIFEVAFDQYCGGDDVKNCYDDSEIYCDALPHFEVKCSVVRLESISKKMRVHLYHCLNLCRKSCILYNHKEVPSIYPTLN